MCLSDDIKNAYYDGYDAGYNAGFEAGQYDAMLKQSGQQRERIFQEIVVEYPSYCIYPEYKGKPYFSIKYTENGQEFIGYGTYKPEVLSNFLKEYFMSSALPEWKTGKWKLLKNGNAICSNCGFIQVSAWDIDSCDNFCHNCGSYNREVEDEQE